ncbi:hypothetical protein C8Q76DRAFT_799060 [Earliella scabrosa]|nr:hypothetical protein C8Q76DRAFT_799060 [Earliella scabrosa]
MSEVQAVTMNSEQYVDAYAHLEVLPQEGDIQPLYPQDTIHFISLHGVGINLGSAFLGRCDGLVHRDEGAFTPAMGVSTKIGLKIQVAGYQEYSRQIMARRANRGADPISIGRLATKIAEEMEKYLSIDAPHWRGQPLTLDHIVLKKLYRVTQGSWQPEFAVIAAAPS